MVGVAIISAGSMGAAIGQRIGQSLSYQIYTIVEGRSQATRERAEQASFKLSKTLEELIGSTSIILSILPPADAVSFSRDVLHILSTRPDGGHGFTFADCNAISPSTTRLIAKEFASSSKATFIDGSIVGGPPKEGYSPTLYLSGDGTAAEQLHESLKDSGLIIKTLNGGIGAASALKMSYATLTKGLSGLVAIGMLGASQNNVLPELLEELATSNRQALPRVENAAVTLPVKSYRWVAEMREIGQYYTEAGVPEGGEVFEGIAKVFERTDKEQDGPAGDVLREAARLAKGHRKEDV